MTKQLKYILWLVGIIIFCFVVYWMWPQSPIPREMVIGKYLPIGNVGLLDIDSIVLKEDGTYTITYKSNCKPQYSNTWKYESGYINFREFPMDHVVKNSITGLLVIKHFRREPWLYYVEDSHFEKIKE